MPLLFNAQQVASCDGGSLVATGPLPDGLSISGSSLIVAPGRFSSHFTAHQANEQAFNYVNTFLSDGLASGLLVCVGLFAMAGQLVESWLRAGSATDGVLLSGGI